MAAEQPAVHSQPSRAQCCFSFLPAHVILWIEGGREGGTDNVAVEVTEERRDVSGKERDCRVKLPLAASAAHVPLLRRTWECMLEAAVGSDSDKHPEEAD